MIQSDQLFVRAEEEALLVMHWRRHALALRDGSTVAGCDQRKTLALVRRCETAIVNLAIRAESALWRTEGT